MPFHCLGSRLSLCLVARVIAWPLMFSIAGRVQGSGLAPAPSVIASGIGDPSGDILGAERGPLVRIMLGGAAMAAAAAAQRLVGIERIVVHGHRAALA